ncbi:ATP-binding protein [Acidipila sp. EB88]|uniref:ATP-binding protein n=1 Tax=Acidipila sp. EB88 TaxID=2305226 RepID=UPI0013155D9B|nr:ATP-binding protein [Acidipila sp. EB88]
MLEAKPELATATPAPVSGRLSPSPELDLTSCDREPIHIPGSIQPHGFLLGLDPSDHVTVCSRNAADFLQQPLSGIFGRTLPDLVGITAGSRLLDELHSEPLTAAARMLRSITLSGAAPTREFEVVAHRTPGKSALTILEFEHIQASVDVERLNNRLYNFVASIRTLTSIQQICAAAVAEIRELTGCDRVVLYRFDEQGHGLVLAEERVHERFASYLGLRFPASDVPVQARRMYLANRVRIIPNVDYEPSPLLSTAQGSVEAASEIDLSSSVLRSVSPIHRQYMRNMGTICSMSVSIIIDGALWGLVSCHHHEARYVPLRLRSACDFIMQIVASQIESQGNSHQLQQALHAKDLQAVLLAAMAGQEHYMEALTRTPQPLLDLVGADGAAIIVADKVFLVGITPDQEQVQALAEWLQAQSHDAREPALAPEPGHETAGDDVFATSTLSLHYPAAAAFASTGSGLLAISLSKIHNTRLFWFRQELVQSVRWAGDPKKPAEPAPGGSSNNREGVESTTQIAASSANELPANIVHPRHSFESWLQIVRAQSAPWTRAEQQTAAEFRSGVIEIVLRRAEEMAALASGLQVANEELEAFSYSVSHDLRAPFRHISGFSEMLREEEQGRLGERSAQYLATIMDSAKFAGQLVDSLLEFSRFARAQLTVTPIDMEELVDHEWTAIAFDEGRGRTLRFSRSPMPSVLGDNQLLRQVLRNLFSNAIKYTGRCAESVIRMECVPERFTKGTPDSTDKAEATFSITDNGVGFDQQYAGKLFGVFQRLHRFEDFEGTGIGLANVRRIIGRHGGRVWAESEVDKGATFYFTLPLAPLPEEA